VELDRPTCVVPCGWGSALSARMVGTRGGGIADFLLLLAQLD
jgi:hypothetical protein